MMFLWPKISVDASPELFTFSSSSQSTTLLPRLFLDSDSPAARILGVGEFPNPGIKAVCVDLFREPLHQFDYSALLAAYLRHGFFLVRPTRYFARRPRVHFIVADSLRRMLHHYENSVFRQAAIEAGALPDHITIT